MELTKLKGIGKARAGSFAENDIFSCEDLINYFPYKYFNFSKTEAFQEDGAVRLIKATAIESPKLIRARNNLCFVSCKMNDETGHTFTAMWFNQTYIKSNLYLGIEVYLYGKNSKTKKNTFVVSLMKNVNKFSLGLLPIYHTISGIGQTTISDAVCEALTLLNINSFLPETILLKYNLTSLLDAYKTLHSPNNSNEIEVAKSRVEIEKLVPILASNEYHRVADREQRINNYKNITKLQKDFFSLLPYTLTSDQMNAISDICKDFGSKTTMNRLLEGDVGSGKTIVAFFGAFVAVNNGYQSAIVAPTEILAKQHYETAKKLFGDSINVVLLTSSLSIIEKNIALSEIKTGNANIVIGTHSIFSENVEFKKLSYVVIDEQHRFGVEQRAKIKEKGKSVDVLVMSATPIPRSMSLVIFGNLDITTLKERPKQANITTNIVIKSKQNNMWEYIKQKIAVGSKTYVVCSKIDEENEDESLINYSAKNMYSTLSNFFDKNEVGLIHGKLKKETQDNIIEKFRQGKIKVLVSTTIVEVGVDVPDSDIMVIVSPERFGLATLHQLRGRIGRNGEEAHCFCLADNLNEKSYERVNFFKNNLNGFDIAEFDLKTRGAGSIYGTNQHGTACDILSNFSLETYEISKSILAEVKKDVELLKRAISIGENSKEYDFNKKIALN